jgi:hypothetical protein
VSAPSIAHGASLGRLSRPPSVLNSARRAAGLRVRHPPGIVSVMGLHALHPRRALDECAGAPESVVRAPVHCHGDVTLALQSVSLPWAAPDSSGRGLRWQGDLAVVTVLRDQDRIIFAVMDLPNCMTKSRAVTTLRSRLLRRKTITRESP